MRSVLKSRILKNPGEKREESGKGENLLEHKFWYGLHKQAEGKGGGEGFWYERVGSVT